MTNRLLRFLALFAAFALACSAPDVQYVYQSGLDACELGGESAGGQSGEAGAAGDAMGGAAAGESAGGQPGGAAGAPGETCLIDAPLSIAASAGLVPQIYFNGDDPGIVRAPLTNKVSLWPNRTGHLPSRDFWENEAAHQPAYTLLDPTLDGRGAVYSDAGQLADGKRLRELVWGPGCAHAATCPQPAPGDGPWGMVLIWKTVNWTRTGNICSSEIVSTRGVHVGEVDQQIRVDCGGGTPIQLSKHTQNGQWTRLIMQFTGKGLLANDPDGLADWACSADQCKVANHAKGTGNATSAKRYLFGLNTTNVFWNNSNANGALAYGLIWKGLLQRSNYQLFDSDISCRYPSVPLN